MQEAVNGTLHESFGPEDIQSTSFYKIVAPFTSLQFKLAWQGA